MALCCIAEWQHLNTNTEGRDGFLLVEVNACSDSSLTLDLFGIMLDQGLLYMSELFMPYSIIYMDAYFQHTVCGHAVVSSPTFDFLASI